MKNKLFAIAIVFLLAIATIPAIRINLVNAWENQSSTYFGNNMPQYGDEILWLSSNSIRASHSFTAPWSKEVSKIALYFAVQGSGSSYTYRVGIQSDDGNGKPSGTWLMYDDFTDFSSGGWYEFSFSSTYTLTAGNIYHIVVDSISVSDTYLGLSQTSMDSEFVPSIGDMDEHFQLYRSTDDGTSWSHITRPPTFAIKFSDGVVFGNPYDHREGTTYIYDTNKITELFTVQSDISISAIEVYARKINDPVDALYIKLLNGSDGNAVLRQFSFTPEQVEANPSWIGQNITTITLRTGVTYKLELSSPDSEGAAGEYEAECVKAANYGTLTYIKDITWGGTDCYVVEKGEHVDLCFRLTIGSYTPPPSEGSAVLYPSDDVYISQSTGFHSSTENLRVSSMYPSPIKYERVWLKYDLSSIPAGATITSVKLRVTTYDQDVGSSYWIPEIRFSADDSWDESTPFTWDTQPSYTDDMFSSMEPDDYIDLNSQPYYEITLTTSNFQSEATGDDTISFVFKNPEGGDFWNYYWFYSKDCGVESYYPRLVISYTIPQIKVNQVTLVNPSIGDHGICADKQVYTFRVEIEDGYGLNDLHYVELYFGGRFYYRWEEETDTFTEVGDTNDYFLGSSSASDSSSSGNTWIIDFKGKFHFNYPTTSLEDLSVYYLRDDDTNWHYETLTDFYYVETRYSISAGLSPSSVGAEETVTASGYVHYWGSDVSPASTVTVNVTLNEVVKLSADTSSDGSFSGTFTAPSATGVYTYVFTTEHCPVFTQVPLTVVKPTEIISSGEGSGTYGWTDYNPMSPWAGDAGTGFCYAATVYQIARFQMFHATLKLYQENANNGYFVIKWIPKYNDTDQGKYEMYIKIYQIGSPSNVTVEWKRYYASNDNEETLKTETYRFDASSSNTYEFTVDVWITLDGKYIGMRITNKNDSPEDTEFYEYFFELKDASNSSRIYNYFDTVSKLYYEVDRSSGSTGIVRVDETKVFNVQNVEMKGIENPMVVLPAESGSWGWFEPLRQAFLSIGSGIYTALKPLFDALGAATSAIAPALNSLLSPILTELSNVLGGLASSIVNAMVGITQTIWQAFVDSLDWIGLQIFGQDNLAQNAINSVVTWLQKIIPKISDMLAAIPYIADTITDGISWVLTFLSYSMDMISWFFTNVLYLIILIPSLFIAIFTGGTVNVPFTDIVWDFSILNPFVQAGGAFVIIAGVLISLMWAKYILLGGDIYHLPKRFIDTVGGFKVVFEGVFWVFEWIYYRFRELYGFVKSHLPFSGGGV